MNNAFMIWDAGGPHGRIFGSTVMGLNYMHIYWKTELNKISRTITDIPGFYLQRHDRADAFGKYRKALKDKAFTQRSYEANKECLAYVQTAKGIEHSGAMNTHDPTG